MTFEEEQKLQRKVEQLIYDSGWIYNTPKVTVQGLAGQIISLIGSIKESNKPNEETVGNSEPWLCMPWVSPHDEIYYGVKDSHECAERLYKEYDGDVDK